MTIFYLVRHGQHDRVAGDQPLNATGRKQAEVTAQHLSKLQIDAIYSSPLARALETARPLAGRIGLAPLVDGRLRERANYGDLPDQTLQEFVAMWRRCDADRDHVPEVGVSARANGERIEQWMRARQVEYPQGSVVAYTHGGTITDFLLDVHPAEDLELRLPSFRDNLGNCSVTIVRFDGECYLLDTFADVSHLA